MNTDDQVKAAEKRISVILSNLEHETGSVVRTLDLQDIDITKMNDSRKQLVRCVKIEMERLPGTKWA
jgi:hypothetical protein